jgi:hypothetical protein
MIHLVLLTLWKTFVRILICTILCYLIAAIIVHPKENIFGYGLFWGFVVYGWLQSYFIQFDR